MGIITTNINAANENLSNKFVFREDIINAINDLKDAKPDNEHSKRSRIINMFRANKIECERDMSAKQYMRLLKQSSIPSISTLPDFCWGEMVSLFKNYKHPKDYMERLVNSLAAPEYNVANDSVRLKILKQFLGKLNYLEGTRLFCKELKDFIVDKYQGVISNIEEDVFEKFLTPGHTKETHKLLEAIIEVYKDFLYGENEKDEQLKRIIIPYYDEVDGMSSLDVLNFIHERNHRPTENSETNYSMNDEYPQLIENLYNYLSQRLQNQKESFDSLIEEIESIKKDRKKQFYVINQTICNCGYDWVVINKSVRSLIANQLKIFINDKKSDIEVMQILSAEIERSARKFAKVNDGIISSFKEYKKEKNKAYEVAKDRSHKKLKKIQLLHICNDLSEGRFKKTYGEMKEILFYFAFAFNMTVHYDISNIDYNFDRDIAKQLFENFYNDNIVRYMQNYQNNGLYKEPLGISIRYNNFVEIVYLYWLSKSNDEYSQYQKLMNAIEMINSIVDKKMIAWKKVLTLKNKAGKKYKAADAIAKYKGVPSDDIRRCFYNQEPKKRLFMLPKDEFENAILKTYDLDDCYKYNGPRSYEGFYNQMMLKTAENEYSKWLQELKAKNDVNFGNETLETLPIINFFDKLYFEKNSVDGQDSERLKKLINKINKRLVFFCNNDAQRKNVTRTNLLFAYYLLFISKNIDDFNDETFADFYIKYTEELNEVLLKSSFPAVSSKNLIDMILLYSAFINLRVNC